jgi:hypothetical protein
MATHDINVLRASSARVQLLHENTDKYTKVIPKLTTTEDNSNGKRERDNTVR